MLEKIKDPRDKAKRIFDKLIDIFEEDQINPTPLNYYVWYCYFKGENVEFRKEMDTALGDPFGYTDRLGQRLYHEYLEEQEAETEFDRAFKRLINIVVQKMNAWSDKLEAHTQELDKATHKLSSDNVDAATLQQITHSVLSTATDMQKNSAEFRKEMEESNEEISKLRKQLIEARAETMTDELTEIGNRKAFNIAIEELIEDARQKGTPLQIIMTDIDHFKRFNDTFGHLVGDSVLRYFSNLMKNTKTDNETICRYGGEEFSILMPNTTLTQAAARAEQIRTAISEAKLKRKDSEKTLGTITASFGIATFVEDENHESFIKRADDALYLAKNSGRNCIKTESDLPEETDENRR